MCDLLIDARAEPLTTHPDTPMTYCSLMTHSD